MHQHHKTHQHHDTAAAAASAQDALEQAGSDGPAGAEHRDTILLLTQALNARSAAVATHSPPAGWWFTPPVYFTDH